MMQEEHLLADTSNQLPIKKTGKIIDVIWKKKVH